MSRFIHSRDMSSTDLLKCSDDALAIISLCENTAWDLAERGENAQLAGNISDALKLATELLGVVHDALETHEGLIKETRRERAS